MDLPAPRIFQKVILPASVPTVFTGIRLAGAVAILVLVAAEMVGAKAGLGYLVNASQFNFAIPDMYAGIITISAIGVAFNQLLVAPGAPLHVLAHPDRKLRDQPMPADTPRQFHLNAFLMNAGHHDAAWRHPRTQPDASPTSRTSRSSPVPPNAAGSTRSSSRTASPCGAMPATTRSAGSSRSPCCPRWPPSPSTSA